MRQLLTVLSFEFSGYLKKKMYVGITLIFVMAIAIIMFFPRITSLISDGSGGADTEGSSAVTGLPSGTILLGGNDEADPEGAAEFLRFALPGTNVEDGFSEQEIIVKVEAGEAGSGIFLNSMLDYTYIAGDIGMFDAGAAVFDELLLSRYRSAALAEAGVSSELSQKLLSAQMTSSTVVTGKDQMSSFFFVYIIVMMLYMAIMLYGQFVAMSVGSEKGSRAMEMLITSAKPVSLMFGKVMGSGFAGLVQMGLILFSGIICYRLNADYWGDNPIIASIFNITPELLFFALLFFLAGFFIYAFIYGALASLVSRTEEIDTTIAPVTFVLIFAFIAIMTQMGAGAVDTPLMIAFSYIPFTSPIAMFVRIAMSTVPAYEIAISVTILLASTIGAGYIAAIIYRMGVLLYGKPPKLGELVKMVGKAVKG